MKSLKKKCINYVNYFVNFWNNRIYSFSNLPYDSFKKPKRTKTYNKNLIRDMKIVFSDDEDEDTEDEYDNASTISLDDDEYNSDYDSEYDSEYIPYDYDTYEMENNQDSDYYD